MASRGREDSGTLEYLFIPFGVGSISVFRDRSPCPNQTGKDDERLKILGLFESFHLLVPSILATLSSSSIANIVFKNKLLRFLFRTNFINIKMVSDSSRKKT